MDDICNYQVEVRGRVEESDLNAMSPLQVMQVQASTASTLFTVCTDQSGLLGLLRHLNGRGLMLLSVRRER